MTTMEKRKQGKMIRVTKEGTGAGWCQSGPDRDTVMVQEVLLKNWFIEAGLSRGRSGIAGTLAEEPPDRSCRLEGMGVRC